MSPPSPPTRPPPRRPTPARKRAGAPASRRPPAPRPAPVRPPALFSRPWWKARLPLYWQLLRGDRPIGILLLLWPTWWGLWLAAEGFPPLHLLLLFTAGVWLTRSAGCVINDYADRWLDPQVERTRARPLATGKVSPREALAVFAVLMLVAFVLVVVLTNRLTVLLAVAGAFLAATYPYLKRYTYLPQVYLGIAFGWGIPMGFAAVTGAVPPLAWLAFLGNVLWATAYDTWYAMVDRDDDLRAGAKSTAILFGDADLMAIGILQGGFVLTMLLVGQRAELGGWYQAGVAMAALLAAWQLWSARDRSRERCFRAFLHNNWVGAAVFAGLALDYLLR
jgi:4-hydroxybenzoate polyprenyltransferase